MGLGGGIVVVVVVVVDVVDMQHNLLRVVQSGSQQHPFKWSNSGQFSKMSEKNEKIPGVESCWEQQARCKREERTCISVKHIVPIAMSPSSAIEAGSRGNRQKEINFPSTHGLLDDVSRRDEQV